MVRQLLWLVAAVLATAAPSSHADEEVPRGRLADDVVPQHYALTLTISDPRQTSFAGEADIEVQLNKPTQRIWFHGHGLTVKDAPSNRRPDAAARLHRSRQGQRCRALTSRGRGRWPRHVAPLLDRGFPDRSRGSLPRGRRGRLLCVHADQPIDARRAFPGFDDPRFKTPFEITVIAPSADKVVANAPLATSTLLENGTTRHQFQPTLPLPTYLIALAVGPLDIVDGKPIAARTVSRAPIPLRAVATRGQGPKLAYALEHTPEIVLALEDYFRIPFPYPKLDVIASPTHSGAMENAGAIIFNDTYVVMDENAPPSHSAGSTRLARTRSRTSGSATSSHHAGGGPLVE